MANRFSPEHPVIRLSGKEVSGLAARVLMAGFLPSGATGGASEAIEFLELAEGGALAMLDRRKDDLAVTAWRAPAILAEASDAAIADAGGTPAHFYGPALADWLAAMVLETGAGAIGIARAGAADMLAATPHALARQGISSAALIAGEDGVCRFRMMLAGRQEWLMLRWPDGHAPAALGSLAGMTRPDGLDDLRATARACGDLAQALCAARSDALAERTGRLEPGSAVLAAFRLDPPEDMIAVVSQIAQANGLAVLSSRDHAALKTRVLAEGWPMDRSLWERLMAFADRSLIATSERSRLGAG